MWCVNKIDEFEAWFKNEDKACQEHIVSLIDLLAEFGPALGRPMWIQLRKVAIAK